MEEPQFVPKDGQVDYSDIRYCPVINCIVKYQDKILLQQRAHGMRTYPGCWSGISGYLDSSESIIEKVYEELFEEAGINQDDIITIKVGGVLLQDAPEYGKTWFVVPVLVVIKTPTLQLNWESADAKWLKASDISGLELLPGFDEVLETFSQDILSIQIAGPDEMPNRA